MGFYNCHKFQCFILYVISCFSSKTNEYCWGERGRLDRGDRKERGERREERGEREREREKMNLMNKEGEGWS